FSHSLRNALEMLQADTYHPFAPFLSAPFISILDSKVAMYSIQYFARDPSVREEASRTNQQVADKLLKLFQHPAAQILANWATSVYVKMESDFSPRMDRYLARNAEEEEEEEEEQKGEAVASFFFC